MHMTWDALIVYQLRFISQTQPVAGDAICCFPMDLLWLCSAGLLGLIRHALLEATHLMTILLYSIELSGVERTRRRREPPCRGCVKAESRWLTSDGTTGRQ